MTTFETAPPQRPTQQQLDAMVAEHGKWLADPKTGTRLALQNIDLVGLQMTGNLSHAKFVNCQLQGATLRNVSMSQGEFLNCDLSASLLENVQIGPGPGMIRDCTFTKVRTSNLRFTNAQFFSCGFVAADLNQTAFTSCFMSECSFRDASLSETAFSKGTLQQANLNGVSLSGRNWVNGTTFSGGSAIGLDLTGFETLNEARFLGVDLTRANATGIDFGEDGLNVKSLAGSRFIDATMTGCKLAGPDLQNLDLTGADLSNAVLKGDMRGSVFRRATLARTQLAWINVEACDFTEASGPFETDNIRAARADFTRANIAGAYLAYADLRGAIFRDARLDHAQLGGADLDGAIWTTGDICRAGSLGRCIIA
ncbi:pentapeptide repeat-containing protein [Shimia biformata]|uniref:pentapeptide repeat-containing protein n=1 Tax=Shimia biformata TaxID=1294299 RepID=UPI00194F77C6|nr:pentapeptide repeat-containing protein [Shimia biformata]